MGCKIVNRCVCVIMVWIIGGWWYFVVLERVNELVSGGGKIGCGCLGIVFILVFVVGDYVVENGIECFGC